MEKLDEDNGEPPPPPELPPVLSEKQDREGEGTGAAVSGVADSKVVCLTD